MVFLISIVYFCFNASPPFRCLWSYITTNSKRATTLQLHLLTWKFGNFTCLVNRLFCIVFCDCCWPNFVFPHEWVTFERQSLYSIFHYVIVNLVVSWENTEVLKFVWPNIDWKLDMCYSRTINFQQGKTRKVEHLPRHPPKPAIFLKTLYVLIPVVKSVVYEKIDRFIMKFTAYMF